MRNKYKRLKTVVCGAALMTFIAVSPATAAEFGHYAPGLPNIRDFFLPEPGFYYTQYNFYYTSNDFRDADGDSVDKFTISRSRSGTRTGRRDISTPYGSVSVDLAVKGTAKASARVDLDVKYETAGIVPTVIYIPEWEILGGKFGMYLSVSAVYARLQASLDADLKLKLGAFSDLEGGNLVLRRVRLIVTGTAFDFLEFKLGIGFSDVHPVGGINDSFLKRGSYFPMITMTFLGAC